MLAPQMVISVDVVCLRLAPAGRALRLEVLLTRRSEDPFAGHWALPGGVARVDERLADTARRLLRERTGLAVSYLEQLATFDALDRDPRGRTIAVAYYALVRLDEPPPQPGRAVEEVRWRPLADLGPGDELAFDHDAIVDAAHQRLRNKLDYEPVAFRVLPPTFTMTQVRRVYAAVQGETSDPTNFPRLMERRFPGLERVEGAFDRASKRPARLYRYVAPDRLGAGGRERDWERRRTRMEPARRARRWEIRRRLRPRQRPAAAVAAGVTDRRFRFCGGAGDRESGSAPTPRGAGGHDGDD